MAEQQIYTLNLGRFLSALGLKENWRRELLDGVLPVLDVTQFLDQILSPTTPSVPPQQGVLSWILVPSPPVGSDPTPLLVPAGKRWRVRALTGTLTTSAVVANRQVGVIARTNVTGQTVFYRSPGGTGFFQTAGQTISYFATAGVLAEISFGTNVAIPIPADLLLRGPGPFGASGFSASLETSSGLSAGDTWTALNLLVEEFNEATPASPGSSGS